jgi:hypothetical protein
LTIEASHESYDSLDEVLLLFRANTFFRNFEIKGPADRVLIYGILFVQDILAKITKSMFQYPLKNENGWVGDWCTDFANLKHRYDEKGG